MTSDEERFWLKVDIRFDPESCWLWQGMIFKRTGYGGAVFGGRLQGAHRVSYQLVNGPIPPGFVVMHRCDTKACVNPAHLVTGTQAENARDAAAHGLYATGDRHPARSRPDWGRHPRQNREGYIRGTAHHSAKLDAEKVRAIRERAARGESSRSIAAAYGVTHGAILSILSGRTWVHVA